MSDELRRALWEAEMGLWLMVAGVCLLLVWHYVSGWVAEARKRRLVREIVEREEL